MKGTDCPEFEGFSDEASVVVVLARFTTWLTAFDVLPPKFESPPYTAVIGSVPTFRVEVVKLAEPPLNAPFPSIFVPFIKETVSPFGGVPAVELTPAVKVAA